MNGLIRQSWVGTLRQGEITLGTDGLRSTIVIRLPVLLRELHLDLDAAVELRNHLNRYIDALKVERDRSNACVTEPSSSSSSSRRARSERVERASRSRKGRSRE